MLIVNNIVCVIFIINLLCNWQFVRSYQSIKSGKSSEYFQKFIKWYRLYPVAVYFFAGFLIFYALKG